MPNGDGRSGEGAGEEGGERLFDLRPSRKSVPNSSEKFVLFVSRVDATKQSAGKYQETAWRLGGVSFLAVGSR